MAHILERAHEADAIAIIEWSAEEAAGWIEDVNSIQADMMNRLNRWLPITVEQVRVKWRASGMRGGDVDQVAGYLQRRTERWCFT